MMADPASGRCWLFYYPSLTSLLVLLRPVDKPNFNILDPQGPVPRKSAKCDTLGFDPGAGGRPRNALTAANSSFSVFACHSQITLVKRATEPQPR